MIRLNDAIKSRSYPWMGHLKASVVIEVFKEIARESEVLRDFKDSVDPRFYKGGVLFVEVPHPAIAHKADAIKESLILALNKRLGKEGINVQDIFYLSR